MYTITQRHITRFTTRQSTVVKETVFINVINRCGNTTSSDADGRVTASLDIVCDHVIHVTLVLQSTSSVRRLHI